jgi:hypothetical protein
MRNRFGSNRFGPTLPPNTSEEADTPVASSDGEDSSTPNPRGHRRVFAGSSNNNSTGLLAMSVGLTAIVGIALFGVVANENTGKNVVSVKNNSSNLSDEDAGVVIIGFVVAVAACANVYGAWKAAQYIDRWRVGGEETPDGWKWKKTPDGWNKTLRRGAIAASLLLIEGLTFYGGYSLYNKAPATPPKSQLAKPESATITENDQEVRPVRWFVRNYNPSQSTCSL